MTLGVLVQCCPLPGVVNKVIRIVLQYSQVAAVALLAFALWTDPPPTAAQTVRTPDSRVVTFCELTDRPADFVGTSIRTTFVVSRYLGEPESVASPYPTQCPGSRLEVTWGPRLETSSTRSLWRKFESARQGTIGRTPQSFTVSGRLYFVHGQERPPPPPDPIPEASISCGPEPRWGSYYVFIIDAIHGAKPTPTLAPRRLLR